MVAIPTLFMQELLLPLFQRIPSSYYYNNPYLLSLGIVLVFGILAKVLLLVFSFYLHRFATKTKTKIDDLIFEHTRKPLFYLILVYGLKLALLNLEINGVWSRIINTLRAVVFIFILSRVLDIIIETWGYGFAKQTKTNIDEVLLPLFHLASKFIFVLVLLMWILHLWNIDITPYLAGVGIGGIVLGLALQDSLKNVFGGVSLIMDKSFNLEDTIALESGEQGKIKEIGLRSTKILTPDNELISVPNGQLANMRIRNLAQPDPKLRKTVDFSVDYGSDVEKVKKIVLHSIHTMKDVYLDPAPDVIFMEMGDSGLKFKARFWVDWNKGYDAWVEATGLIYGALAKAKIGIPYPTHTVYMKK